MHSQEKASTGQINPEHIFHADWPIRMTTSKNNLKTPAGMNESWLMSRRWMSLWMSHVTCEWVMSHMNAYAWVILHMNVTLIIICYIWMSHKLHMKESFSCYIWMSHFTYEWVISYVNESWQTWMSHVTLNTRVKEGRQAHFHICMSHVAKEGVTAYMK